MSFITTLLIAIGLAMDATAVSIANGMCLDKKCLRQYAFKFGICFGFFQGIMPIFGYYLGISFASIIQELDHWIAFLLLSFLGIKMIFDGMQNQEEICITNISTKRLITLGISTSIDALAVGVSFAFLNVPIYPIATAIAVVTFITSFAGVYIGRSLGSIFQKYAELLGGSILILLGIKILIEHLFS